MSLINLFWRQKLYWLVAISAIIRIFLAASLDLGNDEVYYRLYALYPDWSHFDHPLMVGLSIQLFSFNLLLDSELFLRMSSIVLGTLNIFFVFEIGKDLKSSRTGYYAALLYTASVYSSVITGIFILPDTPQQFFWLLSLRLMLKTLPACPNIKANGSNMIWLGILLGFGFISKYTSIFLWFASIAYVLIYNRDWLKRRWIYISILLSFVISLPVLIWNMQNDFISFSFHTERVDVIAYSFNPDFLITELIGEFLYNNPINYILIIIALILVFRNKLDIKKQHKHILLLSSLPLILLFIGFSFFRGTLPHWTAPGVTTLIFLVAIWMNQMAGNAKNAIVTWPIKLAALLLFISLTLGFLQVKFGILKNNVEEAYNDLGASDPTLDLYGYDFVGEEFAKLVEADIKSGIIDDDAILIGQNWFPLANFDYYAATPIGMKSFCLGPLEKIHKYAWINQINGGFKLGMDAYYITDSREYHAPHEYFSDYFQHIDAADTIQVERGGVIAKRAFVFRLKNMEKVPKDILSE